MSYSLSFDTTSAAGLADLDAFLRGRSYVVGFAPSQADATLFALLAGAAQASLPAHVARYVAHIASFPATARNAFPALFAAPPTDDDREAAKLLAWRAAPFGTPVVTMVDIAAAAYSAAAAGDASRLQAQLAVERSAPAGAVSQPPAGVATRPSLAALFTPAGKQMRGEFIAAALRDGNDAAARDVEKIDSFYVNAYEPRAR